MEQNEKLVIIMVGLPARGKSYLAKKIAGYLNWVGIKSQVFNYSIYRRTMIGKQIDSSFFSSSNEAANKILENCQILALTDLVTYLKTEGDIGILDGANTTIKKRKIIEEQLKTQMTDKYRVIFIESIFTSEKIIESHVLQMKIKSVDYKDWNHQDAVIDYKNRIKEYEKSYDKVSEQNDGPDVSYIQIINHNRQINVKNLNHYLGSKILSFLLNLYTGEKPIYFIHNPETENHENGIFGGDRPLTEKGHIFSKIVAKYLESEKKYFDSFPEKLHIYCSTLKSSKQSANYIKSLGNITSIKALDELNHGKCDGLTEEQINHEYPNLLKEMMIDKLRARFPRGESFMDMIHRIEPLIFELERHTGPSIVYGHYEVFKCLYGYFIDQELEKIPYLDLPQNVIIKIVPEAYGFSEERILINYDNLSFTKVVVSPRKKARPSMIHFPENPLEDPISNLNI